MSDLRMELIQGQLNDIEENVRSIKATWGNTIMTLDNIKSSLKGDRQKAIEEAYQKGFEAGQHEATTLEYQQGLDDAWVAAKKICTNWMISDQTLAEIFGQCKDIDTIMHENTAQEAINKIKAYEESQKADAEIKVGDEVIPIDAIRRPFVVVSIKNNVIHGFELTNGYTPRGCHRDETRWEKTGRYFPQVAELVKAMKGAQRYCSSCEHSSDPDGIRCRDCCGQDKWEPKEGAE